MLFDEDECPSCGEKRGFKFSGSFIGCNDEWHNIEENENDSDGDNDYFSALNPLNNFEFRNYNTLFDFSLGNKQKKVNNRVSYRDSCIYWESCKYYEDGEYCDYCEDGDEYCEDFEDGEDDEDDDDDDDY